MVALLSLPAAASAQLLADVTLATAIASELLPGVRLPTGSFQAQGPGSARFVRDLPDAAAYADWEVYTATGLIASLQPAFVRDIANAFAVAGMFQVERSDRVVGAEMHTRYLYSDGSQDAVLYVVATEGSLVWAIGRMAR